MALFIVNQDHQTQVFAANHLYVNMENMDFLPPTAPSLVFAHETYTPYRACKWVTIHGVTPRDWGLLGTKRD